MDTFILIMNLAVGIIGIVLICFGYQKDKTSKPEAKEILVKRIFILSLVMAVLNLIQPFIKHFTPKLPTAATRQDVEEIVAKYIGEKPKNPPVEEAKNEIEKELKAAFKNQEEEALRLYRKGGEAYENNKFKEAINDFEAALKIVKTASLYLSLGNSKLFVSDYKAAMSAYENALDIYKSSKNRQGEGNALCNLGLAYYSLGQYDKAIEYHKQALTIFEEIKSPYAEKKRTWLTELEAGRK